jgi:hypothetical protein
MASGAECGDTGPRFGPYLHGLLTFGVQFAEVALDCELGLVRSDGRPARSHRGECSTRYSHAVS